MGFFSSIENGIHVGMSFVFGWAIPISPYFAILLITIFLTLISTVAYKHTSDQIRLKSIKEEMDSLKKRMKEAKGDMARVSALRQEKEGLSLQDIQLPLLRDYARDNGFEIDREFVFSESADRKIRTKFMEMIEYVKKKWIDCLKHTKKL